MGNKRLRPPQLSDPLEKFLHKQSMCTTDDDSSSPNEDTRIRTPSDNTLSELQSLRLDDCSDQVAAPDVTPAIARRQRYQRRRLMVYSQPYGLGGNHQGRHSSPGEVAVRPADKLSIGGARGYDDGQSSVSFPLSEGEVPVKIQSLNKNKSGFKIHQPTVQKQSLSDERLLTVNKMRNGIDVISVSHLSSQSNGIDKSSDFLATHELDSNTRQSPDRGDVHLAGNESTTVPRVVQVLPAVGHLTNQYSSSEATQPTMATISHQPSTDQSSNFVAGAALDINSCEPSTFTTLSSEYSFDPPGSRPYSVRTPITLTIPTASLDISLTTDKPEHSGDYSSEFDFSSSVSLPLID